MYKAHCKYFATTICNFQQLSDLFHLCCTVSVHFPLICISCEIFPQKISILFCCKYKYKYKPGAVKPCHLKKCIAQALR